MGLSHKITRLYGAKGWAVIFAFMVVVLVVFPLLAWIRKGSDETTSARRQQLLVRIGSTPILVLGLAWLVDRIFQRGWMPF